MKTDAELTRELWVHQLRDYEHALFDRYIVVRGGQQVSIPPERLTYEERFVISHALGEMGEWQMRKARALRDNEP